MSPFAQLSPGAPVTLLFPGVLALLLIVVAVGWLTVRTGEHTAGVIRERDLRMAADVMQTALLDAKPASAATS
ncbi:hypothetical protein BH10PSE6_BH10PSE6_18540 [soil metagenome]